jgi:hypothetical protein
MMSWGTAARTTSPSVVAPFAAGVAADRAARVRRHCADWRRISKWNIMAAPLPFAVVSIPNKGMGCVALRAIHMGERLIAEAPCLARGPGMPAIEESIDRLSDSERAAFYALSQNVQRFGEKKTIEGLFRTNALPNHHFRKDTGAVFLTISRFNHACSANAVFKWNGKIGKMTVHATREIKRDEEISINYGFSNGGVLRDQRRKRLRETFGFDCTCHKCSLQGEELRQSEMRSAAVGDVSELQLELCALGAFERLAREAPAAVLARLDEWASILDAEALAHGGGLAHGIEHVFKCFVEFCEAAAARLLQTVRVAPSGVDSLILESQPILLRTLLASAQDYAAAARTWAERALDVTRVIRGDDSLAYEVWSAALSETVGGFWRCDDDRALSSPPGGGASSTGGSGRFDFYQVWIEAGLGPPGVRIADVLAGRAALKAER